jgi:hypothetical protein
MAMFSSAVRDLQYIVFPILLVLASGASAATGNLTTAYAALSSSDKKTVDELERRTFNYFRDSSSVANGLAPDHWPKDGSGDYFASIAAM